MGILTRITGIQSCAAAGIVRGAPQISDSVMFRVAVMIGVSPGIAGAGWQGFNRDDRFVGGLPQAAYFGRPLWKLR